jgi:PHP family Zn ribbon phosphoesterase
MGLDVIAVADHNEYRKLRGGALRRKKGRYSRAAALELCTQEEVHVLCLFPNLRSAEEFGEKVKKKLPPVRNNSAAFGRQVLHG